MVSKVVDLAPVQATVVAVDTCPKTKSPIFMIKIQHAGKTWYTLRHDGEFQYLSNQIINALDSHCISCDFCETLHNIGMNHLSEFKKKSWFQSTKSQNNQRLDDVQFLMRSLLHSTQGLLLDPSETCQVIELIQKFLYIPFKPSSVSLSQLDLKFKGVSLTNGAPIYSSLSKACIRMSATSLLSPVA